MEIYGEVAKEIFKNSRVKKVVFDESIAHDPEKGYTVCVHGNLSLDIIGRHFAIHQVPYTAYWGRDGEFVLDIHCPSNYKNKKAVLEHYGFTIGEYLISRK